MGHIKSGPRSSGCEPSLKQGNLADRGPRKNTIAQGKGNMVALSNNGPPVSTKLAILEPRTKPPDLDCTSSSIPKAPDPTQMETSTPMEEEVNRFVPMTSISVSEFSAHPYLDGLAPTNY